MERREFLLACAAVAIAPIPATAAVEPFPAPAAAMPCWLYPDGTPRWLHYRYTRLEGDALIFETPWNHMRFDQGLVTITNNMHSDDPAWTRLRFAADRWTSITHEGRSQYAEPLLYLPGPYGLVLPHEFALRPEFGDNLSALTWALGCVEGEQPEWWAENPLLQKTLAQAKRKIYHGRFPVPDFYSWD